jgi:transposase
MDVLWGIFLICFLVLTGIGGGIYIYIFLIKDALDYRKAKKEIFPFVESYKKRCTGINRFVVTVETLQDSFREYNTPTINMVWLDLIKERVIEQDPQDGEWRVR